MLIIFSIILILTFLIFGRVILDKYKTTRIKSEEIRLFQTANIVADTYKGNMEDLVFARIMVKSYGKQANARILVVDSNREVLIDNYNTYIGKTLNNQEIISSIKGQSKSGLYKIEDKEVLQLSVPIALNIGYETKIIGGVLISASLEQINEDIEDLRENMLKISIIALTLALILTALVANRITKPLRNLSRGVEEIALGHLGYEVKGSRGGEVGQLIKTFNQMSHKLKAIEENRKKFINSISHELKTPLTSIKVLIESLSIGNNSIETYREYLKDIYGEVERMENLVDYLMTSIKLEDITLNIKKEDICQILEDTVKIISPYAEKYGVRLSLNSCQGIYVKCDKDRVKEVFINLIDNAIKYRDEGKNYNYCSISINTTGKSIRITVEDNGLGIPEKDMDSIFEGGFRVLEGDIKLGKGVKGYGIGLAVVKSIIDKHKWNIYLDSSLGVGSTFTIEIPL